MIFLSARAPYGAIAGERVNISHAFPYLIVCVNCITRTISTTVRQPASQILLAL